jgi:hypothetical protein
MHSQHKRQRPRNGASTPLTTAISKDELRAALRDRVHIQGVLRGKRRLVRAWDLRDVCIECGDDADPRGLQLANVEVTGELDFAGIVTGFPISFDNCIFDKVPKFEGARLFSLKLTGCCLPGLRANGLTLHRDLELSGSHFKGAHDTETSMSRWAAVWLCDANIGGRLHCVNTKIDSLSAGGDPYCSIYADRIRVGGPVRLIHEFIAIGQIRLIGAKIAGSLDLTGAEVRASQGQAIDLEDADIEGSVFIVEHAAQMSDDGKTVIPERRPDISGRIDLGSARIASRFLIRKALITGLPAELQEGSYAKSAAPGTVIHAPRLNVGARVQITDGSVVIGGIDIAMGELSSLYVEKSCQILSPGTDALNLSHSRVRGRVRLASATTVAGTIRLTGAVIQGDLGLHGDLREPSKASLVTGSPMTINGEVSLTGLKTYGGRIKFRGASLGSVDAERATLSNPGFESLNLKQAVVHGSVRLVDKFSSAGLVVLNRCRIEGRLLLAGGTFTAPAPDMGREGVCDEEPDSRGQAGSRGGLKRIASRHAIEAISADVHGGMDLRWTTVRPSVNFTDATTTSLTDDPKKWPDGFTIAGLTYERFATSHDADARCDWLQKQATYDSGPYEQAAKVFRQQGYANEAEQILIARYKHARRAERQLAIERRKARKARTADAAQATSDIQAEPTTPQPTTPQPEARRRPVLTVREYARTAARSGAAQLRRAGNRIYGIVGYGYRPGRVLPAILLLLVAVFCVLLIPSFQATLRASNGNGDVYDTKGLIFGPDGPGERAPQAGVDTCRDGQVRCFSAGLYAIDTVIPLISLDQRSTWYPDQHVHDGEFMLFVLDSATILGWVLSSIFVLSFARFVRSNA